MKNSTVEESQHVAEGTFESMFSRSYLYKHKLFGHFCHIYNCMKLFNQVAFIKKQYIISM